MGGLLCCFSSAADGVTQKQAPLASPQHTQVVSVKSLRAQARKLGDKRHELSTESQAAWKAGDKKAAHDKSVQAKALLTKIDALNERCVAAIVKPQDLSLGCIDLHKLYVKEALALVSSFVSDHMKSKKWSHIVIVTGAGHHSKRHDQPVIRPKVEEWLKANKHSFVEIHKRGALKVDVPGGKTPNRVIVQDEHFNRHNKV
mmetsp:Transcript_21997/g.43974  ORF Transcript_21997/g.43974 Transcript_21997/m.43974 type:complete len:201 (+) Transcript_21997:143-745(+)